MSEHPMPDLEELERLLKEATQNEWNAPEERRSRFQCFIGSDGGNAGIWVAETKGPGARPNADLILALKNAAPALISEAREAGRLRLEVADLTAALTVCRQSLAEQAEARSDPTMPLLTPSVVENLRADSEAWWACASAREDRVIAHGLSLLCDWQDRARQALSPPTPDAGGE